MKYLLAIVTIILIACMGDKMKSSASLVDVQRFTIETGRDTLIQTKRGALLEIPRGTIVAEKGGTVTLEIQEAYTIEQMIKARLTTQSDEEALSSGGMIYINAASGQQVRFSGRIRVATPTEFYQEGMKLYKGKETSEGRINWTDPDTILITAKQRTIIRGRQLFENNCRSCHALDTQKTGPALAHFTTIFPMGEENSPYYTHGIKDYPQVNSIADSSSSIVKPDTTTKPPLEPDISADEKRYKKYSKHFVYKCNLINRFSGATGPAFEKSLTQEEINSIFEHIENASERLNVPLPSNELKECVDSCFRYNTIKAELEKKKQELKQKRSTAVTDNGSMLKQNTPAVPSTTTSTSSTTSNRPATFDDIVTRQNFQSEYYQFSIEAFGWYNIDMPLRNIPGFTESNLIVRLQGEFRIKSEVFLIIPSKKVYVEGGATGKPDEYAFNTKNGGIFLPLGEKGYIMALSEIEGQMAFAITEFIISKEQSFTLDPVASSKQQFDEAIAKLSIQSIKITVGDSKNADSIRLIDVTLQNVEQRLNEAELLKPDSCDCRCGEEGTSPESYNN